MNQPINNITQTDKTQPNMPSQQEAAAPVNTPQIVSKKVLLFSIIGAVILVVGIVVAILLITGQSNQKEQGSNSVTAIKASNNGDSRNGETKNLEIKNSGWSYVPEKYSSRIFYAVEIHNPYSDAAADNPKIKVTGKDADGKILFSEDDYIGLTISAGDSFLYGDSFYVDDEPESVEITIKTDKYDWMSAKNDLTPKRETQVLSNISRKEERGRSEYLG